MDRLVRKGKKAKKTDERVKSDEGTMVQNGRNRINSHPIIHCPTSERCERTSEQTSEWLSTSICIFDYSSPQWRDGGKFIKIFFFFKAARVRMKSRG